MITENINYMIAFKLNSVTLLYQIIMPWHKEEQEKVYATVKKDTITPQTTLELISDHTWWIRIWYESAIHMYDGNSIVPYLKQIDIGKFKI